jgi:hypothetical protein
MERPAGPCFSSFGVDNLDKGLYNPAEEAVRMEARTKSLRDDIMVVWQEISYAIIFEIGSAKSLGKKKSARKLIKRESTKFVYDLLL